MPRFDVEIQNVERKKTSKKLLKMSKEKNVEKTAENVEFILNPT
jgi:hypothetical protein